MDLSTASIDTLIHQLDVGHTPHAVMREIVSRGSEMIWPLIEAQRKCRNRAFDENLTATLAQFGSAAVGPLLEAMERYPEVRASSAFTLGLLGDPIAVDPLITLLTARDEETRWAAVRSLARLSDPRAVPALSARLKDRSSLVRQEAAAAIRELETRAAESEPADTEHRGTVCEGLKAW